MMGAGTGASAGGFADRDSGGAGSLLVGGFFSAPSWAIVERNWTYIVSDLSVVIPKPGQVAIRKATYSRVPNAL